MKALILYVLGILLIAGCTGSQENQGTDQFGNQMDTDSDGRETIFITPPESNTPYTFREAMVESVTITHSPIQDPAKTAAVEILIKGALPDGCSELHEVKQGYQSQTVNVTLTQRRPTDSICTMAIRPFRFYLILERRLGVGQYILNLNDTTYPFEIKRS